MTLSQLFIFLLIVKGGKDKLAIVVRKTDVSIRRAGDRAKEENANLDNFSLIFFSIFFLPLRKFFSLNEIKSMVGLRNSYAEASRREKVKREEREKERKES